MDSQSLQELAALLEGLPEQAKTVATGIQQVRQTEAYGTSLSKCTNLCLLGLGSYDVLHPAQPLRHLCLFEMAVSEKASTLRLIPTFLRSMLYKMMGVV